MHLFHLLRVIISQAIDLQSFTITTPRMKDTKDNLILSQQKLFEKLFRCIFNLLEEVVEKSPDRAKIIQKLREENEILRPLASLQYTLSDHKLALKCTRLIKKHYDELLLDNIDEALFEFELDAANSERNSLVGGGSLTRKNSVGSTSQVFVASARGMQAF